MTLTCEISGGKAMKFCTHCGKKLEPDERFCTNCGTEVPKKENIHSEKLITSNNKQNTSHHQKTNKHHSTSAHRPTHSAPHRSSKKKKPKGLIAIITIIILILIAALIYALLNFVHISDDNKNKAEENKSSQQSQKQETKQEEKKETQTVSIDVNSDDFSENFMNADNSSGYKGFNIGDSKKQIESQFGKPESTMDIRGNDAQKYGNIAVSYDNDDNVDHVFVVPTDMTTDAFTDFHNTPNEKRMDTWYYDKNKENSYTIKLYKDGDHVLAIENIEQI